MLLLSQERGLSPDLFITQEDIAVEQGIGGFHLFVRKKPDINSVLLVESTRDPDMREPNYAYRASQWNAINGNEKRIIDGLPISGGPGAFSIVDSTPEPHPVLGAAFHLYLPTHLLFGYEDTRHGEVAVVDGTYFNVRTFVLPFADYAREFHDNPFVLRVSPQIFVGPPAGKYSIETIDAFTGIAALGGGTLRWAMDGSDMIEKFRAILEREKGKEIDIVICLDTTKSMRDEMIVIQHSLVPMLKEVCAGFPDYQIGMVLYRDYRDSYLNRVIPFSKNVQTLQQTIDHITVDGGNDIPEAVYEALYAGLTRFKWEAESRIIILIGDAPPHPVQRGSVSSEMVFRAARDREVRIHTIILPE
ncbi:hypothetical protein FACS1894172_20610 [Spirochaetia bacterium]|nr:hypothetical protein FACS1894164_07110 [Spirochaetia bacterium]GHU37249.1 hypothetical protein FACS1894172_20610 [Spirochaetia bacterium]